MKRRELGQHFLAVQEVALFMVEAGNIGKSDTVLEIGPGKGIITRLLAKRAKKVYAIEKDRKLGIYLKGLPKNVEIIWGDALKVPWPKADKMVSNLPFKIASEIILSLIHI